jgi:hypothetical protein
MANGSTALVKVSLLAAIGNGLAAAGHVAKACHGNGLGDHITTTLGRSSVYKAWRKVMPSKTPPEIARYQTDFRNSDLAAVSDEIDQCGDVLAAGQCLFHAGLWRGGSSLVTDRPLSTSLCPQVAFQNALHRAKAYDAGRLDLWVLRVAQARTKAFVFKPNGSGFGHENEVLLASGAKLTVISETLIRQDFSVGKGGSPTILIPTFVLEIDVS